MPRKFFMFVMQAPTMVLGYATDAFLAGLISVVVSPLARKGLWGNEAKVCQTSISAEASPSLFYNPQRTTDE